MLYGSGASGFRAPALIELYSSYAIPTGFSNFKPNPSLAPEESTQGEGGAVWHRRGVFCNEDGLRFRAAFFAAHDNQLIEQIVVGTFTNPRLGKRPVLQYVNVQAARRWGVEWEGEYLFHSLQVSAVYSRVRVSDRQSGEHLYSPPDKGLLHVNYWLAEGRASLSWVSTAAARQDYDSTLTRQRSGWTTHDAFLSVFWGGAGKYRLDAGAANLFDKRYSIYKSNASYPYILETGRDVRISLTTHF
jgi:outer membrane receptor protein involved in Fe transport